MASRSARSNSWLFKQKLLVLVSSVALLLQRFFPFSLKCSCTKRFSGSTAFVLPSNTLTVDMRSLQALEPIVLLFLAFRRLIFGHRQADLNAAGCNALNSSPVIGSSKDNPDND